jgi:hypothetical protein
MRLQFPMMFLLHVISIRSSDREPQSLYRHDGRGGGASIVAVYSYSELQKGVVIFAVCYGTLRAHFVLERGSLMPPKMAAIR